MLTWLRGVLVVAVALTGPAYGESVELPGRTMVGGMVRDDGEALLVMRRSQSARDGSFLVRLDGGGIRTVELPGRRVKTTKPLVGGRLALWNFRAHPGGGDHGSLSHEIIELDGKDKVRSLWEWDSRRDSEEGYGMHPPFVYVSGDGEAWAMHAGASGTAFTFGRTASSRTTRFDSASVTDDEADIDGWLDEPFVTFLESDGPVVLVPRGDGGYILRFADGRGSPHVVPFLRGDGVTEVEFRWQWAERVLWALSSGGWKAHHLPDLGLASGSEAPFWFLERSEQTSAMPHHERGFVRVVSRRARYRVEHLWRDPWTRVEERRVSDWRPKRPLAGFAEGGGEAVFVSPNGRHAVVVEERRIRGENQKIVVRNHAERLFMRVAPSRVAREASASAADGQ